MKRFQKLLALGIIILSSISLSAQKLNVIVLTGGHDFDRESFFEIFDSFTDVSYRELKHPEANLQLGKLDPGTFDAVVFYDMPKSISDEEKETYQKLLEKGKGLVFLHHSLASYQGWDKYKTIIGGKYHEEQNTPQSSTYQHDINFKVKILKPNNPITNGVGDFDIHDEVYGNTEVLPEVTPILSTDHLLSNKIIGWAHQKENSKIVYIQLGHDKNAFTNSSYRKLVLQAIQ
jgi:type 1 glutamine amidotransferase